MAEITKGSLVRIKNGFMGNNQWVAAFVYERYESGVILLITQEGLDLGGVSIFDQEKSLEFIQQTTLRYEFRNPIQLKHDFHNGYFNKAFDSCPSA